MKKIIFLVMLFIVTTCNLNAQWSPLKRLTSGYKDTNPSFNSLQYYGGYRWEFMVFERRINSSSSICVLGLDQYGVHDTIKYLTSNNFINRNPCIAYNTDSMKNALVLWETNQNGRWDIYGSYYNSGIWSSYFPVDSSSGDKLNPKAIQINAAEFGITYSKDGEIIYRRYNAVTKTTISETNLTAAIAGRSDKPVIGVSNYFNGEIVLCFRSQKTDSTSLVYSARSTNNGNTWTLKDSISSNGNNSPLTIVKNYNDVHQVFESDRAGKNGIYSFISGANTTDIVYSSPYFNYYGFKAWFFPFVFDSFFAHINAVVRKSNDSTKILLDASNTSHKDSITIGDSSKNTSIALNNGVRAGLDYLFYMVFSKDSAGFTSLYYKTKIFVTGNITRTGNYIADDFKLYQNYPNPFNPTTKIKFDIPKLSDVKLIIFDAVGREVKNITQNNMTAGGYEYEFNGENLSSGIYYFKLQTNDFNKTVKMVLVK